MQRKETEQEEIKTQQISTRLVYFTSKGKVQPQGEISSKVKVR